ncbi:hypothetical protein DTO063F5_2731 [Paecilomyces variotii]|nr:hypothetical protein DTO063F5_2731 [Paecilomyces variotii]
MGRELQKKKNRSAVPKVRRKRKTLPHGNKKIDVLGNALIAENWDKKLTLIQNYRRLGLSSRLNAPTGGVEKRTGGNPIETTSDSLHINGSAKAAATNLSLGEARVERDPETGKILRIINDNEIEVAGRKVRRDNPLNDPLNDLSDLEEEVRTRRQGSENPIVRQLELQAAQEEELVKKKKPRQQSTREQEWIERLINKHGDNIQAMVRDRKLNPMQQTAGDIGRRIKKWKQSHSQQ